MIATTAIQCQKLNHPAPRKGQPNNPPQKIESIEMKELSVQITSLFNLKENQGKSMAEMQDKVQAILESFKEQHDKALKASYKAKHQKLIEELYK